ncbi:MAG: cbb3-type cytochrome c oxidase subunit I [Deltaproteobacteria bacterium]|nr:cbb3-type cytochrome c oxidase subunit I [Deltaproteobacteria bacterium]
MGIVALVAVLWAVAKGQLSGGSNGARVIFAPGELGIGENPNPTADLEPDPETGLVQGQTIDELQARIEADISSRQPVLAFAGSAVLWLVLGSVLGLIASIKMHEPDWLNESRLLTFGRLRPMHLNVVAYGWLSMAGIASALWLIPRLLRTTLKGGGFALLGAVLWNVAVLGGVTSLGAGVSEGLEWLEFPWPVDALFVLAGGLVSLPLFFTLRTRRVEHLYVSVWYLTAALVWFPILFLVGNGFSLFAHGVPQATVNWWFAHNVLGLWFTPLALAASYYLIPKIIGRPIHSYQLSLMGFWALALFYSHVGIHHLIGGPVPTWLVTVSIVTSMMMFVPVVAVAINQHFTMWGHFRYLLTSPTLRFVVLGAVTYTLVSFQGSLHSLRTLNTLTHFTHYTVAHAHLGAYGFASMIFFGSMYFYLPRVVRFEWPYPRLITAHFWFVFIGFGVYFIGLSIGGLLQGFAMLRAESPFMDSVTVTIPFLVARSVGGALMNVGHLIFAGHVLILMLHFGRARTAPAQFKPLAIIAAELKS